MQEDLSGAIWATTSPKRHERAPGNVLRTLASQSIRLEVRARGAKYAFNLLNFVRLSRFKLCMQDMSVELTEAEILG